jgi:hypothetical protein
LRCSNGRERSSRTANQRVLEIGFAERLASSNLRARLSRIAPVRHRNAQTIRTARRAHDREVVVITPPAVVRVEIHADPPANKSRETRAMKSLPA